MTTTINAHTIDARGVFLRTEQVDPMGAQPAGAIYGELPDAEDGFVRMWDGREWLQVAEGDVPPVPEVPEPTQFERDEARYTKRSAVKDQLLAYMAADNMSRVRSGVWTVPDLTSLLADPAVATANQFMSSLSFELAAQAIATASTPLLTPAIRADWIARLEAAFFTEG